MTPTLPRSDTGRRRLLLILALVLAAGVLGALTLGGLGEHLVYYWTPTELLAAGGDGRGATIRLGGVVEAGSVRHDRASGSLHFAVTDGEVSVPVIATTVPPAMFREGIGVVVEGRMGAGGSFETRRLMVQHDNEYRAPEQGERPDLDRLVRSLETEEAG